MLAMARTGTQLPSAYECAKQLQPWPYHRCHPPLASGSRLVRPAYVARPRRPVQTTPGTVEPSRQPRKQDSGGTFIHPDQLRRRLRHRWQGRRSRHRTRRWLRGRGATCDRKRQRRWPCGSAARVLRAVCGAILLALLSNRRCGRWTCPPSPVLQLLPDLRALSRSSQHGNPRFPSPTAAERQTGRRRTRPCCCCTRAWRLPCLWAARPAIPSLFLPP